MRKRSTLSPTYRYLGFGVDKCPAPYALRQRTLGPAAGLNSALARRVDAPFKARLRARRKLRLAAAA